MLLLIAKKGMIRSFPGFLRKFYWVILQALLLGRSDTAGAQFVPLNRADGGIQVVATQGAVEISTNAARSWEPAQTKQFLTPFDLLRTESNSRCALLWDDHSVISFGASTEIQILPSQTPRTQSGLRLIEGVFSFFHRDKPGQIQVITRGAAAGIEGTEFAMNVDPDEKTTVSVIDGSVKIGNEFGSLMLTNGQQAEVVLGKAPIQSAGFIANDVLQWIFYYPAVLDLNDLQLTDADQHLLQQSLAAYQSGNSFEALKYFPAQAPDSTRVRIYHAALLLSAGNVGDSQKILAALPDHPEQDERQAEALRRLIAAVKHQADANVLEPRLASEFLADSYYQQSRALRRTSLQDALERAKQAVVMSPQFALAWERVAEIEFSFGNIKDSMVALNKSLALAPQNPKALVLKGFLLAAENRPRSALDVFDQALAVNPAIGDAWLGRGLCRIRIGDRVRGRQDLLIAAAIEPQRAVFRSYLGKAYADAGEFGRAEKELDLAKHLDPADPTAWLYSGLLNQERSRINTAIDDMEESQTLNDNRRVYRSDQLLDQDQAVRSANLASMYDDAEMNVVGLDEAEKAINDDYDNYSAHLFLGNAFNALIDPNEINVRYETPAESEFLVANLLAPASAGTLSPNISQGDYSKMFDRDGFGVTSDTEYLSRGAWTESGDQYGTFKDFSYDFESFYRSDPGQWSNNDIEEREFNLALKEQLSLQDMLFFQVSDNQMSSGDVREYYDPSQASQTLRVNETQKPIVGLGYNHEWAPGVNTLFYVTRLNDHYSSTDPYASELLTDSVFGSVVSAQEIAMQQNYSDLLNIFSGELQQIVERGSHTTIVGTRLQYGHFNTSDLEQNPQLVGPFPTEPVEDQYITTLFHRFSIYGYHYWEILDSLRLIGGIAYDSIYYPQNFGLPPLSGQEQDEHQISPKAGLIWTPTDDTTFRAAYTRSLAGASLDQSYQIEPSQVAGFIQSYRSIIPNSVVGGVAGAHFETYDVSLEQKFPSRTYVTISGEMLNSTASRVDGAYGWTPLDFSTNDPPVAGQDEDLDYRERTVVVTANQLLGKEWSLGAQYRWSQAVLNDDFPGLPFAPFLSTFQPNQKLKGLLNQLDFTVNYNHPSGFFVEGEALWNSQYNSGYYTLDSSYSLIPDEPGDSFWQFNALIGYRSPQRRIEAYLGLLNIANQGYNLNPLSIYNELPYKRTIALSFKLNF
jgi:Flp pilus assembly protein TadD/outer membrane receptor protein involved in Fe transport